MSGFTIDIDRLNVALHGVSAVVAEEAMAGLESVLRRRLGGLRGSAVTSAVPELRIGPLDLPRGADAAALRALVADRLLEALVLRPADADDALEPGQESA